MNSMPSRSETIPLDPSDTWQVLVATARGASHEVADTPNQDAARFAPLEALGPGALVSAIADGHGNRRHFRSDRGSHFAVDSACECIAAMTDQLGQITTADQLKVLAKMVIIPDIVKRWRTTVASDVADRPFTSDEETEMADGGDEPVVAYGATLLVVLRWDRWMLLMQIGDGDMVALRSDGVVLLPIPDDPSLDGQHTTSMCQSNATDSFRLSTIDLAVTDLVGVLMATDGFGNAQAADPWEQAVGADLVDMVRAQGAEWVERQLPEWVKQCASAEGSADDTTVSLLLAPISDHPAGDSPSIPGPEPAEVTTSATLPLQPESNPELLVSSEPVRSGTSPAGGRRVGASPNSLSPLVAAHHRCGRSRADRGAGGHLPGEFEGSAGKDQLRKETSHRHRPEFQGTENFGGGACAGLQCRPCCRARCADPWGHRSSLCPRRK